MQGMPGVLRNDDLKLSQDLRRLDDTVDSLYSALKYYLTKVKADAGRTS